MNELPPIKLNVQRDDVHIVVNFMLLYPAVKKIEIVSQTDNSDFFTITPFGN